MSLITQRELTNLKLKSIKVDDLRLIADRLGINSRGSGSDLILSLLHTPRGVIDSFIKEKYQEQVDKRRELISDEELIVELSKVESSKWSAVQGQLDQKIQREYVRKYPRYDELISNVKDKLYGDIKGYVLASWYNHWTTELIEDHISQHPRIVPTLKNIKGVDVFFDGQPFDLKVTNLPKSYKLTEDDSDLIRWMYENQGAERFGSENRLFIVVSSDKSSDSWKLKRQFDFIFQKIDEYLDKASVSEKDEITFKFKNATHTTVSKLLLIRA